MEKAAIIRLSFFLGILIIMALWEMMAPRRKLTTSKASRWTWNLILTFINPIIARLVFPLAVLAVAVKAQENGWGLLNLYDLPYWVKFTAAILVLDMVVYLQHLMFHAVPLFWKLHMVHHTDLDYDVTTGLRFHPIEIIISMVIKMMAVAALGPPAEAVVAFEVILNGMAMFNHGNVRLPLWLDRILRLVVVTPDMHRVHHSIYPRETNSNFGFNLSWWDRLFGTYKAQPTDGHEGMTIGLLQFREASDLTLPKLLLLPFKGKQGKYTINRRGS